MNTNQHRVLFTPPTPQKIISAHNGTLLEELEQLIEQGGEEELAFSDQQLLKRFDDLEPPSKDQDDPLGDDEADGKEDIRVYEESNKAPLSFEAPFVLTFLNNVGFNLRDQNDLIFILEEHGYNISSQPFLDIVKRLYKHPEHHSESMRLCCERNDIRLLRLLLCCGCVISVPNGELQSAFHLIADYNNHQTLDWILNFTKACPSSSITNNLSIRELVNQQDRFGRSPLMVAVANNHEALVHTYLDLGANPFLQTVEGNTSFHLAALSFSTSTTILNLLLESVESIEDAADAVNDLHQTPAHLAAILGHLRFLYKMQTPVKDSFDKTFDAYLNEEKAREWQELVNTTSK